MPPFYPVLKTSPGRSAGTIESLGQRKLCICSCQRLRDSAVASPARSGVKSGSTRTDQHHAHLRLLAPRQKVCCTPSTKSSSSAQHTTSIYLDRQSHLKILSSPQTVQNRPNSLIRNAKIAKISWRNSYGHPARLKDSRWNELSPAPVPRFPRHRYIKET